MLKKKHIGRKNKSDNYDNNWTPNLRKAQVCKLGLEMIQKKNIIKNQVILLENKQRINCKESRDRIMIVWFAHLLGQ